jgi:zinc protease
MRAILLTALILASGLPARPFEVRTLMLENGLTVLAAQKPGLPILEARIGFRSGSLLDPPGKEGLANLTFRLLDKGTLHRDMFELQEQVDYLGGTMRTQVDAWGGSVEISVLSAHAEDAIEILSEVARAPLFDEGDVTDEKGRIVSEITNGWSNPSTVLRRAFFGAVYGDHPLAHHVEGYVRSVESLTRADVQEFYETLLRPERAVLVLVSDLPFDRMFELGRDLFGDMERGSFAPPGIPAPDVIRGRHLKLVHMDVNQAYASFGHLGIERTNPDFNAVEIVDFALGGSGFSSRFMKQVRKEKGYTYSVWSVFYPGYGHPGLFRTGIETKLETAHEAIGLMFDITWDLREHGVTQEELDIAKSYFEGAVPRRTETYGQIAARLLRAGLSGLPLDYWVRDMEEIQALSLDQVNRAAERYLMPDDFTLVIVADTSKLDLEKLDIPFDSRGTVEIR